jgi:N4-gp56 family major capsid protein
MGVKWFMSQNAKTYTGSACTTVEATIIMGRDAFGVCGLAGLEADYMQEGGTGSPPSPVTLITKELGSEGSADPLNQRGTVGWKTSHVAVVLQSAWIYKCEHGSTLGG